MKELFQGDSLGTVIKLKGEMVTPSIIQWMPPGRQEFRGSGRLEHFNIGEEVAKSANDELQKLRRLAAEGKGPKPFIDLDHNEGAHFGEPIEFFWSPGVKYWPGGVMMRARWIEPIVRDAIDTGDVHSFSPQFYYIKGRFTGIAHNVGALLSRSQEPGFARMFPLRTMSKWVDLQSLQCRYLLLKNQFASEGSSSQQAEDRLRKEFPDLFESHALLRAIDRAWPRSTPM